MEIPTSATVTVVSKKRGAISSHPRSRQGKRRAARRLSPNALVHVVVFPIVLINELMPASDVTYHVIYGYLW